MPAGAVKVDRSTKWGNPWKPEMYWDAGYSGSAETATKHCVDAFRAWLAGDHHWAHAAPLKPVPDLSALRGRDLACWCPIGSPCHADVLMEIANR